jgi:hypothetical protein
MVFQGYIVEGLLYMSTLGIESIIDVITFNVSFLMEHAPNLVIKSHTFGRIHISEVLDIAGGCAVNLDLANEFFANRSVAPNPTLIDYVKEFQDSRKLTE